MVALFVLSVGWSILCMILIVIFFWFNRKLLQEKMNIHDDLVLLTEVTKEYSDYLSRIYKMDVFYGDPTVEGFVKKTSLMIDNLKEFSDIYFEEESEDEEENNPQG